MPKAKSAWVVELLDGTELNVDNKRMSDAEELLNHVCEHIRVAERDYFGLRYTNSKDGKVSWLDMSLPLIKQLKKVLNHRFKLGIQFFPDTIHVLQDEVTRYQFVLQTRENLLTGRWSCSTPTQALLASYIVQAEFGNYNPTKHGTDYLNDVQFAFVQKSDFMDKVSLFHQNHHGISPSDADWLYMKTAGKMVMYGMDVYDVLDGDGNTLTFGIDVYGIHVLFLNTVLHSFVWPLVTKICFSGKEVVVTINVSSNDVTESINIGFLLTTDRDARRVAKSCSQHKDFHSNGVVKKPVKKVNKPIPCTHISTRVLPDDFKRVDSLEYTKLYSITDSFLYRNHDETSDLRDSMDEGSSRDTTASNSDELNQSTDGHQYTTLNTTEESIANIELDTTQDTTEDSVVLVDSLPPVGHASLDTTHGEHSLSSGVILSAEDIEVSTVNAAILEEPAPQSSEHENTNHVKFESPDVVVEDVYTAEQVIETEEIFAEPLETSEHNANVNVMAEETEVVEQVESEADRLQDVVNSIQIAETITVTREDVEHDKVDESFPCGDNVEVDQLIIDEYDIIDTGPDFM